jgi:hypothetical protein
MSVWGMPGIGNSLGKCAVCGDAFVVEIMTGRNVATFHVDGIDHTLCAHEKCMDTLEACRGESWTALPENSPLRQAFEKANDSNTDAP